MLSVWKAAQRSYEHELDEQGLAPKTGRRRINDYGLHLKTWDLSQDKSVSEIAKMLFSESPADYARRRVSEHIKAAERLISGGYSEIR
jgi:hypothetical protein